MNEDVGVMKKVDGLLTHYKSKKSITLYLINPEGIDMRLLAQRILLGKVGEEIFTSVNSPSTLLDITEVSSDSLSHLSLSDSSVLPCRLDRIFPHI